MKNKNEIMNNVCNIFNKSVMKIKKHSPEILVIAGVAGVAASTFLACKATIKAAKVIEETKETVEVVRAAAESGVTQAGESYSTEDSNRDLSIIYVQTGIKIATAYAPAAIIGALSITSILTSNNILRKRNMALSASYMAIDKSFKNYRKRVVDRFGDQVDKELKYGLKAQKVEEVEVDSETGKEKKVKKTVMVADPNLESDYAVYFDSKSYCYDKDPSYNEMFLRSQQQFANDKLTSRGHVYLNEVLDDLGLPRIPAGQIVGWTKNGPDGYVDFRIQDVMRENKDGQLEPAILLDFNVEGNIWEKI